jgi:hypothetical protein
VRHGRTFSRSRPRHFNSLVRMALACFDPLDWGHFPARHALVVSRGRRRKSRGHAGPPIPLQTSLNQAGGRRETVTSKGCEGIALATTKRDESPTSRLFGISTFVVITAAPVATPIEGTVTPLPSTVVWLKVRQYLT